MTIKYRIHEDLALVVTRFLDSVSDDEFVGSYKRLLNDPAMRPGYNELADLRECKNFTITMGGMQQVGRMTETFLLDHPEGMRTAVIAPKSLNFALARMYEMWNDPTSESVMVFRDPDEAKKWLGLEPDFLSELHGEATEQA